VDLLQVDTWNPIVKSPNANHVNSKAADFHDETALDADLSPVARESNGRW
jgi:hypothetical protein